MIKTQIKKAEFFYRFVPVFSIFATCLCCLASCGTLEKRMAIIERDLAPLCVGRDYAYDDLEGSMIKMSFSTQVSENGEGAWLLPNQNYSSISLLLFDNSNYYFLLTKKIKPRIREDIICKTDLNLDNFEILHNFGQEIDSHNSGFDNRVFFRVDDIGFVFDTKTNEMKETEPGSSDDLMTKCSKKEYWEFFGCFLGKCKRTNNYCQYYVDGVQYIFDEKSIDDKVFQAMNNCCFEPTYYFASSLGKTGILYYARIDNFWDIYACLIIQYDNNSSEDISYNLFNYCDKHNFRLYPNIDCCHF